MAAAAAPSDSTLAWLQQLYWAQYAARKEQEEKERQENEEAERGLGEAERQQSASAFNSWKGRRG